MLVEVPQRVQAVQLRPPELLREGPLESDPEQLGLLKVDERLNRAECGACPIVVQGRSAPSEEGVE